MIFERLRQVLSNDKALFLGGLALGFPAYTVFKRASSYRIAEVEGKISSQFLKLDVNSKITKDVLFTSFFLCRNFYATNLKSSTTGV